jgi:hypothetical protein
MISIEIPNLDARSIEQLRFAAHLFTTIIEHEVTQTDNTPIMIVTDDQLVSFTHPACFTYFTSGIIYCTHTFGHNLCKKENL